MPDKRRLYYEDIKGVYAIMPTPALENADQVNASFTVDLDESARAAEALVRDGVDAIMINGTFGEAATLTDDEWRQFTKTVIETVNGRIPVIAGPTTLNTRTTIERAVFAKDAGAQGLLLGRPMWNELSPKQTVDFHKTIAENVPELGIVVYNNPAAFKSRITPSVWKELAKIPQVVAAKYGQVDLDFRDAFTHVKGSIQLMPIETDWLTARYWFAEEAQACWSGGASCDPVPVIILRDAFFSGDITRAKEITEKLAETYKTFFPKGDPNQFRIHTIQLEKIRMDAAGYMKAGPCRPPYHMVPEEYAKGARTAGIKWMDLANELRRTRSRLQP